jgi:hypothetical protein
LGIIKGFVIGAFLAVFFTVLFLGFKKFWKELQ